MSPTLQTPVLTTGPSIFVMTTARHGLLSASLTKGTPTKTSCNLRVVMPSGAPSTCQARKPDFDAYIAPQRSEADVVIQVLPTQLIPDDTEGKILRTRLIQREGTEFFDPAYLFDEGSTISWVPCGRKLTCSFPGIKFAYGPDTYYDNEVSVIEMDGQFDNLQVNACCRMHDWRPRHRGDVNLGSLRVVTPAVSGFEATRRRASILSSVHPRALHFLVVEAVAFQHDCSAAPRAATCARLVKMRPPRLHRRPCCRNQIVVHIWRIVRPELRHFRPDRVVSWSVCGKDAFNS